jgi:hypothetical protein
MRRRCSVLWCMAGAGLIAGMLHAQAGKIIIVKVRDGKTGDSVTPSNVQVLFDHQTDATGRWVDQKDDGTIEVKVPAGAKVLAVRATYQNALEYYVKCDVAKQKDTGQDSWYPVDEILSSGISAPNDCVKSKAADKAKVEARPGEFVLFVRKRNWKEQALE